MSKRKYLVIPYIFWIIGFTILPLVTMGIYAFTTDNGTFTMQNILAIFEPVHLKALWTSVKLALYCTVICILLAYTIVIAMITLRFHEREILLIVIVILPMWLNFVLRIMSWQLILSKNGFLNHLLWQFGLPGQELANTAAAVVIGMVYNYLPFMILPIYRAITDIDPNIINAARDLGAGKQAVFFRMVLPLSKPGLVSGTIMVLIPGLTTFAISDMLGGGKVMLIGNVIEQEFMSSMDWHLGAGLSIAIMAFALIGLLIPSEYDQAWEIEGLW